MTIPSTVEALRELPAQRASHSLLEIIDLETGHRSVLKEFDQVIEAPNFTPDGYFIYYNSLGRMHRIEVATGHIDPVDTGFAVDCNNDHLLSPDGQHLAVSHFDHADVCSRIYILPANGGDPVQVTTLGPSYLHGWSPDGQRLAYCAQRQGQYDIYTIAVQGGPEQRLTDTPGLDDGPEYSPDGQHIWFNSTRSGLMQIWRMDADGGHPKALFPQAANCWFPHVSSDGRWVSYVAYAEHDVNPDQHPPDRWVELHVAPACGGTPRVLASLYGGQGTMNVNSWSPDSRHLAFVSYRP